MASQEKHQSSHFIVPLKYYLKTFVALILFTALTVFSAQFDLGSLNVPIALSIGVIKASLVLLFFMGLRWEKGVALVLAVGAAAGVVIFFLLTFSDIAYRGTISKSEAENFGIKGPVRIIPIHDLHSRRHHPHTEGIQK